MITTQNIFAQYAHGNVRSDLEGIIFTAGVVMKADVKVQDGGPRYATGFIQDVWQELQNNLKFRTQYYRPEGGTWGVSLGNGSWSGMIGEIIDQRVDVGVSDFLMTSERMEVVDFLPPLIDTRTYVFIKNNHLNDLEWDVYHYPFTSRLWQALTATVLLIMACLLLNWAVSRGKMAHHSLLDNIYVAIAIFLLQGVSTRPRLDSARAIHMAARMVATVMAAAYSAALVSFLAVRHFKLPFTSYQGLLDDGTYQLGVLKDSAQITYLESSEDSVLRNIYSRLIVTELKNMPINVTVGLETVCSLNKYGFMVELANAWGVVGNLPCDVIKLPHTGIPATMSIVIPKRFHYRTIFSKNVMRMRRTGVLQRLRNLNIPPEELVHEIEIADLRLESLLPLLALLAAGFVTSSFLLLLEILFNMFSLSWRRRKQLLARRIDRVLKRS